MKKRIIPSILLKGGTNVILSQQFCPWRTVGTLAQQLRLHVRRHCDELLIVNLDQAGRCNFQASKRLLSLVRKEVDVPITYVGGISSPKDAALCINSGFDKIYITSAFLDNNLSIKQIADLIGGQSLGVCLPYSRQPHSSAKVWDYRKSMPLQDVSFSSALLSAIDNGAGEILLYNVDKDGAMNGLDIDILDDLDSLSPKVPVLIAGGAGKPQHFSDVLLSSRVQGVVAGSIFALTQETPSTVRLYCQEKGIKMRRS